jgi:NADPH-dependent curcumin reductase
MHHVTRVLLKSKPSGLPGPEHFEMATMVLPEPGDGEALVETLYVSMDPYMRGQISGRHISGSVKPGDMMRGEAVSRVSASNTPALHVGELVAAHTGWQSHAIVVPSATRALGFTDLPVSLALGVLGMPGLTAYAGLTRLAVPKAGDMLLVSSAAGTVGATVGQIGRILGCRVTGIAGGLEKCRWVKNTANFDESIDYKTDDLRSAIARLCPPRAPLGGVDIYFDNVGGDVLQAAMENLAFGARVVLCGLIDQYNTDDVPAGPNPALVIRSRATVRGMVVYDHEDLRQEMQSKMSAWIKTGVLVYREDVTNGLEQAGHAFSRMMRGDTFGKVVVKVAD